MVASCLPGALGGERLCAAQQRHLGAQRALAEQGPTCGAALGAVVEVDAISAAPPRSSARLGLTFAAPASTETIF